jgi:ABC-type polar amino acid transport system ATPase subunit
MEASDVMSDVVLAVRGLRMTRGARTILGGVDLDVRRGELLALRGPSGSGKTTILRAVAGLDRFDAGRIKVGGIVLDGGAAPSRPTLAGLRQQVGMVFQFHHLFEHLSALDNVCLAPVHVRGAASRDAHQRGRELLAQLGVEARATALPRELSGGEAQRVAIARALAMDPPLLLMDEPMASLDPARRYELGTLLQELTGTGRTLILTSHDEGFTKQFATRTISLDGGLIC